MWYSHCFRRHPAPFYSLHQINQTAPNSLRLSFRSDPPPPPSPTRSNIPPICPPYVWWLFLAVFSPPKGLLALPAPRFCCWNVLSAPHITSEPPKLRTDRLFLKFPARHWWIPSRKEKIIKGKKKREKKNVTKILKNPSKCIHVSCRWKSNPRCQAQFL